MREKNDLLHSRHQLKQLKSATWELLPNLAFYGKALTLLVILTPLPAMLFCED